MLQSGKYGFHFPVLENATADKAVSVKLRVKENDLEAFFRIANKELESVDAVTFLTWVSPRE